MRNVVFDMPNQTAPNSSPLPIAERKALVAEAVKAATDQERVGLEMIDFREPNESERSVANELERRLAARTPAV